MCVWREAKAADGRVYYWHTGSKERRWERPADYDAATSTPATPATPAANPAAVEALWKEAKAPDGRSYFYNVASNEVRWEAPEGFLSQPQQNAPAFVAGSRPGPRGGDEYGGPPRDRRMVRRDDRDHGPPQRPSFDDRRAGGGGGTPWERPQDNAGFRGPMPIKTDEPDYASPEQAEEAFFKVLKRNNVTPDTTWEDALRAVVKDRDFRALKDPKDRRQAFDKYCIEVRAQEKGKERERKEKLKEDFRLMLKTHDDIKHYTRWKSARPIIEREAVFKQAGDEDGRRAMFEEYIIELKRRHAEEETEKHRTAMRELQGLLQALIVDADTKWATAHDSITENERFASNDLFRALSDVDLLAAFDRHIKELDRTRHDAKQKEKQLRTRRERQARDAFRQVLAQHLAEGHIKPGTKWQDFHHFIKDDESYLNLVGTPGSSPLDLFWDAVEVEERKLRSKRNVALDVLDDTKWEMTVKHTLQDFVNVVGDDPRMKDITDEEVAMIFDRLMAKVIKRAEEDKVLADRAHKKAIDALRSVIKHLDPPVRLGDTYEDIAPRLTKYPEYQDLEDSEDRRSAFEKHMRRLKEKEEEFERDRARRAERDARSGRRDERDRRHRTRTPEADAYEADRRRAQETRERHYRKASFGLTPPPRDRRDDRGYDDRRRQERVESIYDRERREREMERERSYVNRADPRDKGRTLDYGDEDAVGSGSRPGSVRKRRESDGSSARGSKRTRRGREQPEPEPMVQEEAPALQSGSEEGEIEEV